jgi:hypothetical protein
MHEVVVLQLKVTRSSSLFAPVTAFPGNGAVTNFHVPPENTPMDVVTMCVAVVVKRTRATQNPFPGHVTARTVAVADLPVSALDGGVASFTTQDGDVVAPAGDGVAPTPAPRAVRAATIASTGAARHTRRERRLRGTPF